MLDEKAQMNTLEGVAAAAIMLLVITYAIDATSMTPLTSSTANVHVETELQTLGQDILSAMDYSEPGYNSKLKNDVLNWDGNSYSWNGTQYLTSGTSNNLTNNLTAILNATLVSQGIAHDVELVLIVPNITSPPPNTNCKMTSIFFDNTGIVACQMIYNGNPSDNAVTVSRRIVIYRNDINQSSPLYKTNPIYQNNIDNSTNLYNIVEVRLTLWRM